MREDGSEVRAEAGNSHVEPTKSGGQKQCVWEGVPPFWQLSRTSHITAGVVNSSRRGRRIILQ